jgi:hypothetical protein
MIQRDVEIITVVSGLPRSGTSLMMHMLKAGGLQPLIDNVRQADDDNPNGYFEFEKVKKLAGDNTWLHSARGKCVKIISALLRTLPSQYHYKVIFMDRNLQEVIASQHQMLVRRGVSHDQVEEKVMVNLFNKHLQEVDQWLLQQTNMQTLHVDYGRLVAAPLEVIPGINAFLGGWLDQKRMALVVDPGLHRQRA